MSLSPTVRPPPKAQQSFSWLNLRERRCWACRWYQLWLPAVAFLAARRRRWSIIDQAKLACLVVVDVVQTARIGFPKALDDLFGDADRAQVTENDAVAELIACVWIAGHRSAVHADTTVETEPAMYAGEPDHCASAVANAAKADTRRPLIHLRAQPNED